MSETAKDTVNERLRGLPSVDSVLSSPPAAGLIGRYGRERLAEAVRETLGKARESLLAGEGAPASVEEALEAATGALEKLFRPRMRKVLNLTGVAIHTNLGRAALAGEAAEAARMAALSCVNVEYDLERGVRGDRDGIVEELLTTLTGAEAATVVNNNAAAVLLALNTLAEGREVLISRGELIEIGGSFRLPEVMARSGCVMREVGTTNKTRANDYENAFTERTALVLRAHTSNYRIVGFTSRPALPELAAFAKEKGVPLMEDLGSGTLVDLSAFGLPHEPTVQETVRDGADAVTFSGDKLLGGPQAGIIAGRADIIKRIKSNHLKRALRVDKMTLAALEATLRIYLDPEKAVEKIPALRSLAKSLEDVRAMAEKAAPMVAGKLGGSAEVFVMDDVLRAGAGSLPEVDIPSVSVAVRDARMSPGELAEFFRRLDPPVIGRVEDDLFRLDMRCLDDVGELAGALA
ncbi:MAG: L-seryl-tRNA(Sec) selenium transferase [Candidatus Nitrospinota bacterium M3_3B_026]